MRIHRLVLRSYRGVGSCELTFAEHGVTVVEGDNEVGKSSAAEALRLVLTFRDDSTHKDVKAVRALHLDAGAEVEVELTAGPHRLVFAKRWHRERYTQLKVLSPVPEVVSGREAHDRVLELLGQTVDLELWRALSAPQAEALQQRALRDHPSLVAALDVAAGGASGAGEEGDLLERATAEAGRWFTPTGRPKGALAGLRDRAARARDAAEEARSALERLEADVVWCADHERSAEELDRKHGAAVAAAASAHAQLAAVQERCDAVEHLALEARLATTEAVMAQRACVARAGLVADLERSAAALAAARDRAGGAAELSERAGAELAAAGARHASAQVDLERAAEATEDARASATVVRGLAALRQAETRLAEAERHEHGLAEAAAALAANPATPTALAAVQEAHEDVLRSDAARTAGRPAVRIEALRPVDVVVGGTPMALAAGQVDTRSVAGTLTVEAAGTLRVTVGAGADAIAREAAWARATETLAARCAALGVGDLAAARALAAERLAAERAVRAEQEALGHVLQGTTVAAITDLVAEARIALAGASPAPGSPTAADLEAARATHDALLRLQHLAEREADRAEAALAVAERAADAAAASVAESRQHVTLAELAHEAARRALAAARDEREDEALRLDGVAADERAAAAERAWQQALDEADDAGLAAAAKAAQRAATERDGLEKARRQVREDLAAIRARLEVLGEAGLHDRLAEAEREADAAEAELASCEARAAAAELLLSTLSRHRDEAAQAYGAPLRREIESLGARVFGDGFGVQLDDELRIAARVLGGVPVPWADLSAGAKEQLAVITRLAAATLVSRDGGVPVLFDDVLGFTDRNRLALVAEAFEAAAEHCQIIVLTCDPERYRHLARATTHCLTAPRPLRARQAG